MDTAMVAGAGAVEKIKTARRVHKAIHQTVRTATKPMPAGQGLAERPHHDIDTAVKAEVLRCASSIFPQNTRRVGVIDHQQKLMLLQFPQARAGRNVAINAEQSVGDNQTLPAAVPAGFSFQIR